MGSLGSRLLGRLLHQLLLLLLVARHRPLLRTGAGAAAAAEAKFGEWRAPAAAGGRAERGDAARAAENRAGGASATAGEAGEGGEGTLTGELRPAAGGKVAAEGTGRGSATVDIRREPVAAAPGRGREPGQPGLRLRAEASLQAPDIFPAIDILARKRPFCPHLCLEGLIPPLYN